MAIKNNCGQIIIESLFIIVVMSTISVLIIRLSKIEESRRAKGQLIYSK